MYSLVTLVSGHKRETPSKINFSNLSSSPHLEKSIRYRRLIIMSEIINNLYLRRLLSKIYLLYIEIELGFIKN